MILNLNAISFKKFGIILNYTSQKLADPEERSTLPLNSEHIPVRITCEPVQLFPEPGLCVLSVAIPGEEYMNFYLDKPVSLYKNVQFFVTPFGGNNSLRVSGKYQLQEVLPHSVDFRVQPRMKIPRMYTFFYQEREQGFVFPGESHDMYEITYVDKGTLHSVAEGQDHLLEPGDLILYAPGQWHMQYADIGVAPGYVTVSFDVEGLSLDGMSNRKFRSPQKALDCLRLMLREQEHPDDFSEDMILGLLRQLLLILLRLEHEPQAPVRKPQGINNENEIVRRAQQFISNNVRSKLTVPLVAKNIDVSPSYLTSLFHKHLQLSPGEYIRRIKLQESKQMIREGNLNFSEIASALHYSTIHHFSRQFKGKFGITPTEYAKSVK
ncbi:MAG: AraC family transcriptional regulator [Oscillospiraceae bacterium]|nr:AraC family transcriptional regulator [Oscillospiraceae bacterium]